MDKQILERLQKLEDETSYLKEELTSYKVKSVRLERELKTSEERINFLENNANQSSSGNLNSICTCKCEDYKKETILLNKKVIQLEEQSKDVEKTCEQLSKLQHLLNCFMLKAQKSFLQENQEPPAPHGTLNEPANEYHSRICNNVEISHSSGTLMHQPPSDITPNGKFVSSKPLSPECSSFSFRIISSNRKCYVAIGVCTANYPTDDYLGWTTGSIAYHADDGGIYLEQIRTQNKFESCGNGDIMKCQLDFDRKTMSFYKNGKEIYKTEPHHRLMSSNNDLYACIGMAYRGEEVQLLETRPWRQ